MAGIKGILLLRPVEINEVTNFKFAAGKHSLQIRVLSAKNHYDQIETLDVDLAAGSERILYVNCSKHKMQVMLQ